MPLRNRSRFASASDTHQFFAVHNPIAKTPMPVGLLPSGQAYHYNLQHEDWRI